MKTTSVSLGILFAVSALYGCAAPPLVRDAIDVDPQHYTVDFENDRVRVIRIKYGPHEKSVMHQHRDAVAVFLSEHQSKFSYPDGSTEVRSATTGQTLWAPAAEHLPENLADEPVELVLVELKR